jgi:hypothetical protein
MSNSVPTPTQSVYVFEYRGTAYTLILTPSERDAVLDLLSFVKGVDISWSFEDLLFFWDIPLNQLLSKYEVN